jgi:hypothetical protein
MSEEPFGFPTCPSTSLGMMSLPNQSLSLTFDELNPTHRVDPERRFFAPDQKAGPGAAEWVNPCETNVYIFCF